jgi:Xaa-Pro aminopeptidase
MSDRIDRLRAVANDLGADAAIVSHPANRRYFSGFPADDHAPDESYGVLLVSPDAAILYTSPTNLPWAEATVRSPVSARAWERPWQEFVGRRLRESGVTTAVFEDSAMSVADHTAITAAAPAVSLLPAEDRFHALRARKEREELAAIARAARITDAAFVAATTDLTAGTTERQLAWTIELAMRDLGADGPGFPIIVAAGPHGARPHHDVTDRAIEPGEPVVIDIGATVDGYTADLTRTVWVGEPLAELTQRYNAVLAAQQLALANIRPGMTGRDADEIARAALTASGLADQILHGLGHGVGLLVHEFPSMGVKSDDVLAPGHVITVEPGVYFDGWGGIRIEDLCVVTESGLETLSAAPK